MILSKIWNLFISFIKIMNTMVMLVELLSKAIKKYYAAEQKQ